MQQAVALTSEGHHAACTRGVVLSTATTTGKSAHEEMMELMFETFGVPWLDRADRAVLAVLAAGRCAGVSIRCGGATCSVTPVVEGEAMPHVVKTLSIAGESLTAQLGLPLPPLPFMDPGVSKQTVTMPDGSEVVIPDDVLTAVPELLFAPDSYTHDGGGPQEPGLHRLVMKSLDRRISGWRTMSEPRCTETSSSPVAHAPFQT